MKPQLIFLVTFPLSVLLSQSPDSILCHTQDTYRSLSKYKDEGTFIDTLYGSEFGPFAKETRYFLYCDRQQQIDHWVEMKQLDKINRINYVKPATDTMGVYTSYLWNDPIPSNMSSAGARMTGSGSWVLSFFTSLLYDNWYAPSFNYESLMLRYDTAYRLSDTILLGVPFNVIQTKSSTFHSQAMIDRDKKLIDSIRILHPLTLFPEGLTLPSEPIRKPYWRHRISQYYIRQSDFMIHRYVVIQYEENQLKSKRIHLMNPTYEK